MKCISPFKQIYWLLVPWKFRQIIRMIYTELRYGKKVREELNTRLLENDNKELLDIKKYLNNNYLTVFNYKFVHEYKIDDYIDKIKYDFDKKMYYVDRNGIKMYISRLYSNKTMAADYIMRIDIEQNEKSPHRYVSNSFPIRNNTVLIDIGGAEGFFSADYIDLFEKVYIFECDPNWVEALEYTFNDFIGHKVHIIDKCVSDYDDDNNIRLDSIFKGIKDVTIKMDVEGMEPQVLMGANELLNGATDVTMYIASYHKGESVDEILPFIAKLDYELSSGYMVNIWEKNMKEPFLRRGVIRAHSKEN